jgi:aminopeptidase
VSARREPELLALPFDPRWRPARATPWCIACAFSRRKVTLITDLACREIAAALAAELEATRRAYQRVDRWKSWRRARWPTCRAPVLDDMETSQVSIFAVRAQANELRTRMQMTDVVNRRKMRHAHMVNIDRRIMLEGMRADFDEVDRISTQVWRMASAAREIRATNARRHQIVAPRSNPD